IVSNASSGSDVPKETSKIPMKKTGIPISTAIKEVYSTRYLALIKRAINPKENSIELLKNCFLLTISSSSSKSVFLNTNQM
ncbi:MAG: hypothetical protein QMD61_11770, partial [Methanobacterium sp.]|nr:hypothetical protein [Methanobacterium sp.]